MKYDSHYLKPLLCSVFIVTALWTVFTSEGPQKCQNIYGLIIKIYLHGVLLRFNYNEPRVFLTVSRLPKDLKVILVETNKLRNL